MTKTNQIIASALSGVSGAPQPAKLTEYEKRKLEKKVSEFIACSEKLSKIVNRFAVKAGRIYLYHLIEQMGWDNPEAKWLKPLIDGKYAEFPYARITVLANKKFSLDWQRHTGQWIQLFEENSLQECFSEMENDTAFFYENI